MKPDIDALVEKWRKEVLEGVCAEKCYAKTCCSMKFDVSDEQARLIFGISASGKLLVPKNSYNETFLKDENGSLWTNFVPEKDYCPQLIEGRCQIYHHSLKPAACSEFPLGVNHDKKILAYHPSCMATRPEHSNDFFSAALDLGYKVIDKFNNEINRHRLEMFEREKAARNQLLSCVIGHT